MKHLTNIIVALCFGTFATTAVAQSDLPTQTLSNGFYSGGFASAQSIEFTEGIVIEAVIVPFFTRYYAGDQQGTLNVYIGHGVEGTLYATAPITVKGLNRFFPLEDLIGLTVTELESYWSQIWVGAQDGVYTFDDLATEFSLSQFGQEFPPGVYTFELVLSNSPLYQNEGVIWATAAGNCNSDFACPTSYAYNPYPQGNFYWGSADVPENIYTDADMAFAFKRGLSTGVDNSENSTKQRVTAKDGVISFPNAWIGETFQVFSASGELLATGRLSGNLIPVQASAYEHLLYRVGKRSGHVDMML